MTKPIKLVPGLLVARTRSKETYFLLRKEPSSLGWVDEGWTCYRLETNMLVWLLDTTLIEYPWDIIQYP